MQAITLPRLLAAVAIGVAYQWVVVAIWGRYMFLNPINEILLDVFARNGHLVAYRVAISIHDIGVNILAALPFAAAFLYFPVMRNRTYVSLAAAAALVVVYAPTSVEALPVLLRNWAFWFGVALVAFSLPAAYMLLDWLRIQIGKTTSVRNAA